MNRFNTLIHACHMSLVILLSASIISACSGIKIRGTAIGRMMQDDCTPVANHEVVIVNRTLNSFLTKGKVSIDYATTDDNGYFEFNVGHTERLHIYSSEKRSSLMRTLNSNLQIGFYENLNELSYALESSHNKPLIVYPKKEKENDQQSYYGYGTPKYSRGQYSEWFSNILLSLIDVEIRFGLRGRDTMLIVSAGRNYNVAEVTKTEKGQYIVGEFYKEISYDNAKDIRHRLLLFSKIGKPESVIVNLQQDYNTITEKTLFLTYSQKLKMSQHKPGPLMANIATCGGNMDQSIEGWYTNMELLSADSMRWFSAPAKTDAKTLLQAVGYINSDDAMKKLYNDPRLTQDLLMQMTDYDFFDARYTQSIIDFAQNHNWRNAVKKINSRPRPKRRYNNIDQAIQQSQIGISTLHYPTETYIEAYMKPKTVKVSDMEYMYCMNYEIEDIILNPNIPNSIMFDIVDKYASYRTLPYLVLNPTTPPELLEKIYFGDYPHSGRAYEYDLLSCDQRLTNSVRKYTFYTPPRKCKTDFPQHTIDLIMGTNKKNILKLDCEAYRDKTLASLHPEVIIKAFGTLYEGFLYEKDPDLGKTIESRGSSHIIDAIPGNHFGIMYTLEGNEYYDHLGSEANLSEEIIAPDGHVVTQGVKKFRTFEIDQDQPHSHNLYNDYALYIKINTQNEAVGDWIFRIKHKGVTLAEQVIMVK